eukprot:SAG31_NODE_3445_length_4259_cov_4.763702_2_plen_257_part_00
MEEFGPTVRGYIEAPFAPGFSSPAAAVAVVRQALDLAQYLHATGGLLPAGAVSSDNHIKIYEAKPIDANNRWRVPDAPKLVLSNDRCTATDTAKSPQTGDSGNGRYRCVIAEEGFSADHHSWDIRVNKCGGFEAGVVTANVSASQRELHQHPEAWVLCVSSRGMKSSMWNENSRTPTNLPQISDGSMINFALDCESWTLTITVTDTDGHPAGDCALCELKPDNTYFPVAAFGGDVRKIGKACKLFEFAAAHLSLLR